MHVGGKKISKSHTTIIDESDIIIKKARKLEDVSKVIVSQIKVIRNGPRRIKISKVEAGLKIMVRGIGSRQNLFVYTKEKDKTESILKDAWNKKYAN